MVVRKISLEQYCFNFQNQEKKIGNTCEIKCSICGKWFRSPINYGSVDRFLNSSFVNNNIHCKICGNTTKVLKKNMRYCYKRKIDGRMLYI
jgi:hypothetical protein